MAISIWIRRLCPQGGVRGFSSVAEYDNEGIRHGDGIRKRVSAATVAHVLALYTIILISEVEQYKCGMAEFLSGGYGGCETMVNVKEGDAEEAECCGAHVSAFVEVFSGAEEE